MTPASHQAAELTVGLDLGGTKLLGIVIDRQANVLARVRRPTGGRGNAAIRDSVLDLLGELLQAGPDGVRPTRIGIGAPGYVDTPSGTLLDATNLEVRDLPLGRIAAETFGVPVVVLHDVKASALAEARLGAAAGSRNTAFVNVGTGIAAGLIVDGRIVQGAAGRAGELGHVVMLPDGPRCPCGLRGCLEALAAGPALVRATRAGLPRRPGSLIARLVDGAEHDITAEVVAAAARAEDPLALEVIRAAAGWLGLAVAGLVNLLDLDSVIVGGGLSEMGELLLGPVRAAAVSAMLEPYRGTVPIVAPVLGADAGVIGAALAGQGALLE